MQQAFCDGQIVIVTGGPSSPYSCTPLNGSSGQWLISELSVTASPQLLNRDDFNILSASVLAILIVAMGLRFVLKTLNIGVNSNEKN